MDCPKCGFEKTTVEDSRGGMIRRRFRACPVCGYRFFTVEAIEADAHWLTYKEECKQMGLFDHLGDKNEKKGAK